MKALEHRYQRINQKEYNSQDEEKCIEKKYQLSDFTDTVRSDTAHFQTRIYDNRRVFPLKIQIIHQKILYKSGILQKYGVC